MDDLGRNTICINEFVSENMLSQRGGIHSTSNLYIIGIQVLIECTLDRVTGFGEFRTD